MAPKKKKHNAAKSSKKGDWIESDTSINNPFAALLKNTPKAASPSTSSKPTPKPKPAPQPKPTAQRAVIRTTRKGRGGKTVTVVTHLNLSPSDAEQWCKDLRKQLGCGGGVEDGELVFNGDQRKRLPDLLNARGVQKITQG